MIGKPTADGDPENYNWDCLRDRLLGNPAFPNLMVDLSGMPELRVIGSNHLPPGDNPAVSANHAVILPAGLETIGDYALWCDLLSTVQYAASGSNTPSRGLSPSLKTIGANAMGSSLAIDKLPAGVESIGQFAFYNNPNVTLTELPPALKRIGQLAFQGCPGVAPTALPAGLTEIEDNAFSGTGIGRRADGSPGRLVLPAGLTGIQPMTFFECSGLGEVVLPSGIARIGVGAFENCENLKAVIFKGKAPQLWDYYYINSLPELYPNGITAEMAFGRQSYDSVSQVPTYSLPPQSVLFCAGKRQIHLRRAPVERRSRSVYILSRRLGVRSGVVRVRRGDGSTATRGGLRNMPNRERRQDALPPFPVCTFALASPCRQAEPGSRPGDLIFPETNTGNIHRHSGFFWLLLHPRSE